MDILVIRLSWFRPWRAALLGLTALTATADLTPAHSEQTVLYRFGANEKDGAVPQAGVILDESGALYGTTFAGGAGFGTVFKLSPPVPPSARWKATTLYRFKDEKDGYQPVARLVRDKSGALYGTTARGGGGDCGLGEGCGTVFRLNPPTPPSTEWTKTLLHRFADLNNGGRPNSALIFDKSGALYGTTFDYGCCQAGTVFKLTPPESPRKAWAHSVLYRFQGDEDGQWPYGGLVRDKSGSLYGTTSEGSDGYHGTVFKLTPSRSLAGTWIKTKLHSFKAGKDGRGPYAGLVLDKNGTLYGSTRAGGSSQHVGWGTVFKLTPPAPPVTTSWSETVIYRFKGGKDGEQPEGDLTLDSSGSLFGTTQFGGFGYGTVFKLTPPRSAGSKWTKTILHRFRAGVPKNHGTLGGLVLDSAGTLYGTTWKGGHFKYCTGGCGTVYKIP